MNDSAKFLKKLRGLSWVKRWNFHPHLREESVAEHSYWVCIYTNSLCNKKGFAPTAKLQAILLAMFHDMEESITGDMPALVKRGKAWDDVIKEAWGELGAIIPFCKDEIKAVVKSADLMAALLYAQEQVEMGNTYFQRIRGELIGEIQRREDTAVDALMDELGYSYEDTILPLKEMSHL